ncbi:MAG: hypothetical protein ACREMY_31650, partial [bacterium]
MAGSSMRLLVLLLFVFAAACAGMATPSEPRRLTDFPADCIDFCPDPMPQLIEALDTRPLSELAAGGNDVIRVFPRSGYAETEPVIEVIRPRAGPARLTVRALRPVDGLRRLIVRSIELSDAQWNALSAEAGRVIAWKTQKDADDARRLSTATGEVAETFCTHQADAYFEYADRRGSSRFPSDSGDCGYVSPVVAFSTSVADRAVAKLSGCDTIDREFRMYDGTTYRWGRMQILDSCLAFDGLRRQAGEAFNAFFDFLVDGYEPDGGRDPIDVADIRKYFANDCQMNWA